MSDEKKKYVFYSIIVLIIVSILACLFLCSGVQDNGLGIDAVREQLDTAGSNQQKISDRIDSAEERTQNIQDGIEQGEAAVDNAAERVDELEKDVTDAGELIKECKHILSGVRSRGKTTDKSN